MPSIMVYTEETFYYTDGIRVVAREEYMRPDVTELSFYRKEGFWFGFVFYLYHAGNPGID